MKPKNTFLPNLILALTLATCATGLAAGIKLGDQERHQSLSDDWQIKTNNFHQALEDPDVGGSKPEYDNPDRYDETSPIDRGAEEHPIHLEPKEIDWPEVKAPAEIARPRADDTPPFDWRRASSAGLASRAIAAAEVTNLNYGVYTWLILRRAGATADPSVETRNKWLVDGVASLNDISGIPADLLAFTHVFLVYSTNTVAGQRPALESYDYVAADRARLKISQSAVVDDKLKKRLSIGSGPFLVSILGSTFESEGLTGNNMVIIDCSFVEGNAAALKIIHDLHEAISKTAPGNSPRPSTWAARTISALTSIESSAKQLLSSALPEGTTTLGFIRDIFGD